MSSGPTAILVNFREVENGAELQPRSIDAAQASKVADKSMGPLAWLNQTSHRQPGWQTNIRGLPEVASTMAPSRR
jgi:hypothetical protein